MSSNALTVVPQSFSQEQIDIIKSQVAPKGTTNDELAMFLQYCQRTGLDPFARQIYLSDRRSKNQQTGQWDVKRVPETTIDGFRVIAERSRQYAGQLGPFWCGEDGEWKDVWIPQKPPVAAKVGILRHDFKEPLWAVALYDEYVQTKVDGNPNSMWAKMPANQLAKCAESLGHRKAFPRELGGLYTREEMPTEQHEAKEAQRDYLRSKGIDIDTSGKRKADVRTASEQHKALIVETAKMLDEPPASPKTIEMRHAATIAGADQALKEVAKPPAKKKGQVSFDVLKHFKLIKEEMCEAAGDDTAYYAVLNSFGYEKSNEITDNDKAREIYKALGAERNRLTQEKDLRSTLEEAATVLGTKVFMDILALDFGCENIDAVLQLEGVRLEGLLKELKLQVDARRSKS